MSTGFADEPRHRAFDAVRKRGADRTSETCPICDGARFPTAVATRADPTATLCTPCWKILHCLRLVYAADERDTLRRIVARERAAK